MPCRTSLGSTSAEAIFIASSHQRILLVSLPTAITLMDDRSTYCCIAA
jgi:hypothetical protein